MSRRAVRSMLVAAIGVSAMAGSALAPLVPNVRACTRAHCCQHPADRDRHGTLARSHDLSSTAD
jgi:hypothetical protein